MDITSAFKTAANLGATSPITGRSASVADNYETFLSLLMTQLKNQDPSAPLDTNQFTQQLIQYSEVEQQIQANRNLEALVQLSSANAAVAMVGYVGRDVTLDGSTTALAEGKASWQLKVPAAAGNVTYVVKDARGNEVYSRTGSLAAGQETFSWDGTMTGGGTALDGPYTLSVTAFDANNKTVSVGISFNGLVQGVDMSGDQPVLIVDGKEYDVSDVLAIHLAG